MTTNTSAVTQSVQAFKSLDVDDRLAVLASIYSKVAEAIPPKAVGGSIAEVTELVSKIEQLSKQEQVDALRDLLPAGRTDQDEVVLDPHPSQALAELATGGTTIPTGEYGLLSVDSKFAFWYHLGQKLGSSVISIPADYRPSTKATEFLSSLGAMDKDEQVSFLSQVL